MNHRLAFAIIFALLSCGLVACAVVAFRSKRSIGKPLGRMLLSLIPPVIGNYLIIISTTRLPALVGCYLYYIGIDFTAFQLLRFALAYCGIPFTNTRLRILILSLFGLDIFQLLANIVFGHAFGIEEIQLYGAAYYRMIPYLAQNLHRALVYATLTGMLMVYLYKMLHTSRMHAWRYAVIFFTLLAVILWCTFYVFSRTPLDRSMIGYAMFGLLTHYFCMHFKPRRLMDRILVDISSDLPDALFIFDEWDTCFWANTAGIRLAGIQGKDFSVASQALAPFFAAGDASGADNWTASLVTGEGADKKYYTLEKRMILDNRGRVDGSFLSIHDDTQVQMDLQREAYIARHDELTGLYTRPYLYQRISEAMAAMVPGQVYSLIYMNVRSFKLINDIFGPGFGDEVLQQIARLLRTHLPAGSLFGRLGGDTFGIFLPKGAISVDGAERILSDFTVTDGKLTYQVQIHLGVYTVDEPAMEVSAMFDRARIAASYLANNFHDHISYYNEQMRQKMVWEQEITTELRPALDSKQIRPYLQPLVDANGKVVGAEALVRWIHPKHGFLSPAAFIPVFEKNSMITEVDRYMWRCACELLVGWRNTDMFLSINISPKDFFFMDVAEELKALTREYGIDPARLRIEITESVMISDVENKVRLLSALRQEGFLIEMDDFGSGYSSLNMLKDMPIDVIKIDMGFLRRADEDQRSAQILRNVISMSQDLGIVPLTEGVETRKQFDLLTEMGCQLFQGYYFAKPMAVEDFERTYLK